MAWRERFCGDVVLLCATAFELCYFPLSVVSSQITADH
jgi:hypothetical protein